MDMILRYLEDSPSVFFKWRNESGWPVEYVNGNVARIFGYTREDFLEQRVRYDQIIHPADLSRVIDEVIRAGEGSDERFEHDPYRIITSAGETRWVKDTTQIERDENGAITAYYGYITDVTLLKRSKDKLRNTVHELRRIGKEAQEYRRALDTSYIVSTSDPEGNITSVNDNFLKISGYTREELIGRPHSIMRHPSVPKEVFEEMWNTIRAKECWQGMLRNKAKDGRSYFVKMTIIPILGEAGNIEQYIGVRYDMTGYVKQQEQIKSMAFRSIATGLPNLYALVRDIDAGEHPVLALVNIDGFKVLNNLYGYRMGDLILKELTRRLSKELGKAGFRLYHIHADEFGVLAEDTECEAFADTLLTFQDFLHAGGVLIQDKQIPLHISIACSVEPKERLLVSCNMAMHYARSQHKRFVRYDRSVDFSKDYHENLRWTTVLHEAINEGLICPHFQPIYDIHTNTITKFEALIRICKGNEIFTPNLFMEIAKQVKLYGDISRIMLEKTFEIIRLQPYAFSINLSVEDIQNSLYTERLWELLSQPRRGEVILEIVESEGIENFEGMERLIERAKSLGARLAIDDFGTGYSNLESLLKLNADYLKIDGSLIRSIDTDIDAEDIVRTIVSFANKKNIEVIAEVVANERVLEKITQIGIRYAQGYFIGKPSCELMSVPPPKISPPVGLPGTLTRLIYVSRAARELSFADAQQILDRSWENNRVQGISGVLTYDGTYFIQCLEGESETVLKCFERISRDERHYNVCLISTEGVAQRMFRDWTMSYVGDHVHAAIIPSYTVGGHFDPYTLDGHTLLKLLDEIHHIA